jgi:hypothetical protein
MSTLISKTFCNVLDIEFKTSLFLVLISFSVGSIEEFDDSTNSL